VGEESCSGSDMASSSYGSLRCTRTSFIIDDDDDDDVDDANE